MDNKQYSTRELFRRFAPYFKKYRFTLWMDLFCAALTTVCELVHIIVQICFRRCIPHSSISTIISHPN